MLQLQEAEKGGIPRTHYILSRQCDPSSGSHIPMALPDVRHHVSRFQEASQTLIYFDRRAKVPVPAKTTSSHPPRRYAAALTALHIALLNSHPKSKVTDLFNLSLWSQNSAFNSKTHQPYMCAGACPAREGEVPSRTAADSKRHCLTCSLCSYLLSTHL